MGNWSLLPYDILSEIVLKLVAAEEFACFSAVCRSFNRACLMVKHKWHPKIPWLLLAENTKTNPNCRRKVFSLDANRCYELELPQTFGKRCWGSSCGFVVTLGLDLQFHLFNPLTKAHILLPPQTTMSNQLDMSPSEIETQNTSDYCEHIRTFFVAKVIVIEEAHGGHLVVAIHGRDGLRALSIARPGDKEWTNVNVVSRTVYDVCCWDGRRIYVLHEDGVLGYFEMGGSHGSKPMSVVYCSNFRPPKIIKEISSREYTLYMMHSHGDLLMVVRCPEDVEGGYQTWNLEVYRLNFGQKEWEQINDLGDVALFVGDNISLSVDVSACSNFERSCIYYTDDGAVWWSTKTTGEYDMGVFNMASGDFEELCDEDFYAEDNTPFAVTTPFWFIPRF